MPPSHGRTGRPLRRWVLLFPVVIGVCLLLVAVVLLGVLVVRRLNRAEARATPTAVPEPAETAVVSPLPTPLSTPQACTVAVGSAETQQTVPQPVLFQVGEREFPVVVVYAQDGTWTFPEGYSGAAAWVCGTVVNYLIQLEATSENQQLLEGLQPGSTFSLRLSNGGSLQFRFAERRVVNSYATDVLAQVRPRLTLIVPLESGMWQVVIGDYVAEAGSLPPASTLARPNQPVRVGNVQVTVTSGTIVRDVAALQPGTVAYVVEFTVENVGSQSVSADEFVMTLQDGSGQVYPLSAAASAAGASGPLNGTIAPGVRVSGSVGYVVPETIAGPTLIWSFALQSATGVQASFAIPFEGQKAPSTAGRIEVVLTEAFLSSDRGTLVVEGEIRNLGEEPASVDLNQITLTSSAGMGVLRMAAPPLPWTIPAGQTQVIELQYAKPDAPAVLLTIAGYSFEIQGLE